MNLIFPIEFNHLKGGMLLSVVALIKHLSKNYKCFIISHKNSEIHNIDCNVVFLDIKNQWVTSIKRPIATFRTFKEVHTLLNKFDPQNSLVITNNVASELVCSGFGFKPHCLKRVFISRGGDFMGKTGFFLKLSFKSVFKFIAISNHQKSRLVRIGVDKSSITIIHNGVLDFNEAKMPMSFSKTISISIVGFINRSKNQMLGIETLKVLIEKGYDIKLNIYGVPLTKEDEKYFLELKTKVEKYNLTDNVVFRGFVKNQRLIYTETDILLSCSLSEGFGRTIIEAMSCGVPCIGLKESGGLLDIINDKHNGLLITNNKIELKDAILSLIHNNELCCKIIDGGLKTFKEKFSLDIMIENYLEFFKNLSL